MLRIEEIRKSVDREYVGISPDTRSVRTAHIANGLYRTVMGKTYDTSLLNRFVVSQKHNGQVPKGHDMESVVNALTDSGGLVPRIQVSDLRRFRGLLKRVVNADGGVFLHRDAMESYTAGHAGFVTRDRIAQSGGEFVGQWIRLHSPQLRDVINTSLELYDDPVSLLSLPLLRVGEPSTFDPRVVDDPIPFFQRLLESPVGGLWNGMAHAASTLGDHLVRHPNKLYRLRLIVLFSALTIVRHLACLEAYYCPSVPTRIVPFLLDFSPADSEPVAKASLMGYAHVCQSISRFYAWAFGQYLRERYSSIEELCKEGPPTFKRPEPSAEWAELWQIALSNAGQAEEPFTACGQALYDILASEAEGDPIRYLRQLGHRCGLMWPPENLRPAKRFVVQQDMLEVIIRGSVGPGETIGMPELQRRLWDRFGIVVGGRYEDQRLLDRAGIYQADGDALLLNRERFASRLGGLDFARLLADGVLQVQLEGE